MLPLDELYANTKGWQGYKGYIFFEGKKAVGLAMIDTEYNNEISVAVLVNPPYRRQGYGRKILYQVLKLIKNCKVNGYIESDNLASIRLAEHCGFEKTGKKDKDGFIKYLSK